MIEKIYIKGDKFNANGEINVSTREVTIYKGSTMNPLQTSIYGEKTTNLKERLIRCGIIKNNVFTEDFTFDYPATASSLISGSRAGYKIIKLVSTNKSIKEILK
jgi:hypothetical protein